MVIEEGRRICFKLINNNRMEKKTIFNIWNTELHYEDEGVCILLQIASILVLQLGGSIHSIILQMETNCFWMTIIFSLLKQVHKQPGYNSERKQQNPLSRQIQNNKDEFHYCSQIDEMVLGFK